MKFIIFCLFLILCYLTRCFGKKIQINVLTYTFTEADVDDTETTERLFDIYAQMNNLNITLNMEMMKFIDPSDSLANFKSLVETSLKKSNNIYNKSHNKEVHSTKFDIYIFDNRYTNIYGPYLLDLRGNLPKEHIEMYDSKILNETSYYKDKLVGLPMFMTYEVLYSNTTILDKYNKPIPKTWDELIDICKYILEKEKDTNPELICYNGLFDDSEQGLYSLYSFIHSCRDSYNSTYPNFQDQSFKNSLILLKKLKDETKSDDIFRSDENFTYMKLYDGNFIFLKYFIIGHNDIITYPKSILPGMKEGISSSSIVGNDIGIIKNIPEEKKDAAIEVYKFFTSKITQHGFFSQGYMSAVNEFWDDEELCQINGLCDLIKSVQYISEPKFIHDEPEKYRKKYQKYIYQYLYGNKSIDEILKQFNDITKVYYVSLDTEDSNIGLICFIYFSVISAFMLLSLIFIYRENFNPFFRFLSEDFWIVTVLGSIMILWVPYLDYGPVEKLKCHLKPLLLSIGYTINICPTMHKLITQFPEENKISVWVNNHRYIFLLFFVVIDILLCSISLINPYTSQPVLIEDGESFEICRYNGIYSIIILYVFKFLIVLSVLFLIFVEWNNSATMYDMRFIIITLYIDILVVIPMLVFHIMDIKNYIGNFIIQTLIMSIISISNYILLFGFRLLLAFIRKKNLKLQFINNINEKFINNDTKIQTTKSYDVDNATFNNKSNINDEYEENENPSTTANKTNFFSRMVDYHYTTYNTTSMYPSTSKGGSGNESKI